MANIRKIGKYTFINTSKSTSTGFRHETTLFIDDFEITSARVNYINRTWENYQYQTCMQRAVEILIENRLKRLRQNFMTENNYCKMTKKRFDVFKTIFDKDSKIIEYKELYEAL